MFATIPQIQNVIALVVPLQFREADPLFQLAGFRMFLWKKSGSLRYYWLDHIVLM